jgi:ferredoxin
MKTTIYYYTGTGNSLWAARKLAAELKDARVASMRRSKPEAADAEAIGLAFPVHVWGLPSRVIDFVNKLPVGKSKYYFALGVNAGQVAGTLNQLKKLMAARGLTLNAGYDLVMPTNYIPWGGAIPEAEQEAKFAAVAKKIKDIAGTIEGGQPGPVEKGPLWQRMFLSGVAYKFTFNKLAKADKDFWSDDKCNACAICTSVCPSSNIIIDNNKPVWQGRCEQCLACIQWCPLEAIQFGKKTPTLARYHHPQVTLSDMMS